MRACTALGNVTMTKTSSLGYFALASASPTSTSATSVSALIDSPLMRNAGRDLLSLALMDARNHTLHLFSQLQKSLENVDFAAAHIANVNPPLWALGHVGWHQEWFVGRNMQRALGSRAEPVHARLASIEPNADRWWSPANTPQQARWTMELPSVDHTRAYLLETLESTLDMLDRVGQGSGSSGNPDDALYFYRLCLFHEDMLGEALVCSAQTLGLSFDLALREAYTPAPLNPREPLLIPATVWQLGHSPDAGFAFDNEKPQHSIAVPEFEIDAQPVSWSQFVEFVDDGGYDQPELWAEGGWQWLQGFESGPANEGGEGRRAPRYVEQIGVASGAVMQTRFGHPMRMLGNQSAMHLSWWEADAWCRWAGRRLPAEVEWEVAAHVAGRRGFKWGEVWEWTGTTFRPYPGFKPGPDASYSQAAFGTHKVLRGASFATRARMKNSKYRNFQLPERDDIFCGFRSCAL